MRPSAALPLVAILAVLAGLAPSHAAAAEARPDTTWVNTFDGEFFNWANAHVADFEFPADTAPYAEVLLYMTIACPEAPGDCDPWDRLGHLRVVTAPTDTTEVHYEIARFVTPYDITGHPSMPGSCTWVFDVTDYKFMLEGTVTLRAYIESWIGGEDGWLLTCDFAFVGGTNPYQPFAVVNLWLRDWMEYGNPINPIEDLLLPVDVDIPADAAAAKLKAVTTGHGQGNTFNCAEFCPRWHTVWTNGEELSHTLWRLDCAANPCSPQYGTWQYNRAGWCPGDKADPWETDVTGFVVPGETAVFDYEVQPYENLCGPHNPDCVSGQTCPDCNYNYNGHTIPIYTTSTQLVLYRFDPTALPDDGAAAPEGLRLGANHPNPFNPTTTFSYTLAEPGAVALSIHSAGGRLLRLVEREHGAAGTYWFTWNGRDDAGRPLPSGVYFYAVEGAGGRAARKMILLQ